jgi:hypothetical protein
VRSNQRPLRLDAVPGPPRRRSTRVRQSDREVLADPISNAAFEHLLA